MDKSSLGDRMKEYEAVTQIKLTRRTPVIIRVDGKAFHTMTKRWNLCRPFDALMHCAMTQTTMCLVSEVQNAVFAYTQSDEISILLKDWSAIGTQQWFDGKVQKIVSIAASIASVRFAIDGMRRGFLKQLDSETAPLFDARVYNIPKEEVVNYFIWRQQDASRNSVQMYGRAYFSHKQLQGKNNSQIQDMLMEHPDGPFNWNDLETWMKRGTCVYRGGKLFGVTADDGVTADFQIPIFTKDREYIERHLRAESD